MRPNQISLPPVARADSLLARYLDLIAERDGFTVREFAGMRSDADNCVRETFGDEVSAYWLAHGRVLAYQPDGDTLRATLELVTVAAQEPGGGDGTYDSQVTARIRTDTLSLKLVPDSTRARWQICGRLSDGHELGGYGRPENVHYAPVTASRASLLRQVDSLRRAIAARR